MLTGSCAIATAQERSPLRQTEFISADSLEDEHELLERVRNMPNLEVGKGITLSLIHIFAGLYGHVAGNRGQVNLCQKNRAGREGFRFGLDVAWNDSLVRAGVTPPDPVFGYEPWTVNPGNYLVYRYGKSIDADLDMRHGDQRFAILSLIHIFRSGHGITTSKSSP